MWAFFSYSFFVGEHIIQIHLCDVLSPDSFLHMLVERDEKNLENLFLFFCLTKPILKGCWLSGYWNILSLIWTFFLCFFHISVPWNILASCQINTVRIVGWVNIDMIAISIIQRSLGLNMKNKGVGGCLLIKSEEQQNTFWKQRVGRFVKTHIGLFPWFSLWSGQ